MSSNQVRIVGSCGKPIIVRRIVRRIVQLTPGPWGPYVLMNHCDQEQASCGSDCSIEDDDFVDALEYQTNVFEYDNLRERPVQPDDGGTAVLQPVHATGGRILADDLAQMDCPRREYRRDSYPHRRSPSHDRYFEALDIRRRLYIASRRAADAGTSRHRDNEAVVELPRPLEMRRRREDTTTAEAERIQEEGSSPLTLNVERETLKHQNRHAAGKARRQDDIITVSPQMRSSRDYRGEHVLEDTNLSKTSHRRSSMDTKTSIGLNNDSSDDTAVDDIEVLVREWTTLYDLTTLRDSAPKHDLDIDRTIIGKPELHTYHSI
jgi:hypothetical protein